MVDVLKIDGKNVNINELVFRPCMKNDIGVFYTNEELEFDGQKVNGQYYYLLKEEEGISLISRREFNQRYKFSSEF
jgi:hypothetical protein